MEIRYGVLWRHECVFFQAAKLSADLNFSRDLVEPETALQRQLASLKRTNILLMAESGDHHLRYMKPYTK